MSAGFNCAYDDEPKPAVLLVTAIATGETEGICADCIHAWGLVMAGVDPNHVDEVLTRYVYPPTDEPAGPAEPSPAEPTGEGVDASPPVMVDVELPDLDAAESAEAAQRAELHDRLAARPDAARTSADVIPDPVAAAVDDGQRVEPGRLAKIEANKFSRAHEQPEPYPEVS